MPPVSRRDRMAARRLEDRIRELCARVVYSVEPEWTETIGELQLAIVEHSRRVANLAATATVARQPEIWQERRGR